MENNVEFAQGSDCFYRVLFISLPARVFKSKTTFYKANDQTVSKSAPCSVFPTVPCMTDRSL